MNRILSYFLVLICIFIAYQVYSCSRDGYKQITIKNELGSYSLEYPSHYKKNIRDNLEFKVPYTDFTLEGPVKKETVEVFDPETGEIKTVTGKRGTSSISINICNLKVYYGESYSAVDFYDDLLQGLTKWENFRILERSPITVAGIEGELVVYLVDKLMPIPVEDGKNLTYVRAAYFDYNDLVWEIEAKCNQDIQDEVTGYFNHVIETFEILE